MLSARRIFEEIRSHDPSFQLFCSIAAKGESQGGWENERIALLTHDSEFAPKIARHGRDEEKHGRLFRALLRKRGLEPVVVPEALDYCMLLERRGIGLSHERLRSNRPLSDDELLDYLAHSRVTEQRASEEIAFQVRCFDGDAEVGKAARMIAADEERHLAYCHEELLRFAAKCGRRRVDALLREYAHAEIRTYRDVSLGVTRRMAELLGWGRVKRTLLAAGIQAIYAWERAVGWRRMVALRRPALRDAMGENAASRAA